MYLRVWPLRPSPAFGEFAMRACSASLKDLDEQPCIEGGDDDGDCPGQHFEPWGVRELTHLAAVAGESYQWEDCEAQLHAQDNLAEDEQPGCAVFAIERYDDDGGDDGREAGDEAALPLRQADVEEALPD